MKPANHQSHTKNPVRVLLVGTYCSKNKGDAAMQQVFSEEILEKIPGADISIASPFPTIDTDHYAPVKVVRSRRRNLPLATLYWLLLDALRLLGYKPHRFPLDAEIDAMLRADAVVDLSGDMLTEDYGPLVGYSHFLPLLLAQALDRPVAICAQSIGPFHKLAPLAQRIFSRARLITVREPLSAGMLDNLQLPDGKLTLTADLAFQLRPAPADRINAIFAGEDISPAPGLRLGVSVSALLSNRTNRRLANSESDKLAAFAQALDRVIESLGAQVLLVPHVCGPRPSGDDRRVGERLAKLMHNPVQCLRGEYRPEELKGIIATCDLFVGCRMHANIAALDSGVPVLAVGYSHKTRGIMADFGLEEWVIGIHDLDAARLIAAIARLHEHSADYRHRLAARLPDIRRRSRDNIGLVATIIESARAGIL